jgi:hypothetical protein
VDVVGVPPSSGLVDQSQNLRLVETRRHEGATEVSREFAIQRPCAVAAVKLDGRHHRHALLGVTDRLEGPQLDSGLGDVQQVTVVHARAHPKL